MILAAGLGERMRPLTLERAKSSIPLFNKPFILHAVEYLQRFGIQEIAINLHHQPDSVTSLLQAFSSLKADVRFSHEDDILGTAGGVKKLERYFGSEPFVLMNSDFVSDINLDEVIEYHRKEGPLATLVLQKSETKEYSKVKAGTDGKIEAIGVPEGNCIFCGLHILEPDIFEHIPINKKVDINRDIYSSLLAGGLTLKAYEHKGFWFEFGNLKRYLQGHIELAQRGPGFIEELLNIHFPNKIYQSGNAQLSKLAKIHGFLFAGEQCHLADGVSVEDSILHSRVVISHGAQISNCIIGENVTLPEEMNLFGCVVANFPDKKFVVSDKEDIRREGSLLIKKFLD